MNILTANPYGDNIVDIMKHGAMIVRFKYVSNNKSLPLEEKVLSYHAMNFKEKRCMVNISKMVCTNKGAWRRKNPK
jgi:hypothetical protein